MSKQFPGVDIDAVHKEPQMEIGNHSRVFEYDGAYRCLDCQARWGALPGQPKMPAACLPPADVTAAEVRTVLDRKGLEGLLNMRDPFAVRELLMKALDTPPQYVSLRVLSDADPHCPKCGHNRDKSSTSSIEHQDGTRSCQLCGTRWVERSDISVGGA